MNKPSSTITAAALGGACAAVLFGLVSVFFPEKYALVPPGMEGGASVLIGSLIGWRKKETTLPLAR